jgi:diaminopimelate epimerase
MKLQFYKMSGAGNDFVVADNRGLSIPEEGRREWIEALCRRGLSVGADGVLLVEPAAAGDAHFRMRYYNSDGGEAESCGNGARCIARFANRFCGAPERMRFETLAGTYAAEVMDNGEVEVSMTDPHSLRRGANLEFPDFPAVAADHLDTGVPHAVVWVDDVETVDIVPLGRAIRKHEAFSPKGANANFAQVVDKGNLLIRTYERGVEDETLACGTGCIASAALGAIAGFVEPPVKVLTRGGIALTIGFDRNGEKITNVKLRGEARFVYQGELIEPFIGNAS